MKTPVWTVSNFLSASRIAFVVPIAYCLVTEFPHHRWWSAGFMLVAVATDFFDGWLARKLHQVSELGKVIDPLADKIGVGIVAVLLVMTGDLPLWYLVLVLARDVLILAGGMYIKRRKNIIAQSNWPGKIAVSLIAAVLVLSVLRIDAVEQVLEWTIRSSVVFMAFSMILYAQRLFIGRKAPMQA